MLSMCAIVLQVRNPCCSHPARLGRFNCRASFSDVSTDAECESDAGTTPRPCVNQRRSEWFHHSVAWNAARKAVPYADCDAGCQKRSAPEGTR